MTQEQIKKLFEDNCKIIKMAEDNISLLGSVCKHPNTFEGNYSHRIGNIQPATICSDCGACIKIHTQEYQLPNI
jgi:hypothetical protein